MAYTAVDKHSVHFNNIEYTGNNTGQSITGVGFQPDLVWNKSRSNTESHNVWDAVRGTTKGLVTNAGDAESTWATGLTSFDSDGFTVGSLDSLNDNSLNFAAWCWKANGAGSANTDGSINSTATSANTTAGFSIVKYTGTGSNATVGHGLGVAPKMILIKGVAATWWFVYHAGIPTPTTAKLNLNTNGHNNDAQASYWNSTAPTSSVFSLGTEGSVNSSGADYIAYCFADVAGYSKMGNYIGNSSTDGNFCYTGFKPKFLILKRDNGDDWWGLYDSVRSPYNVTKERIYPNTNDAGADVTNVDFLSNGFKLRTTDGAINATGGTYIFMAFGQSLVGSNNVPCTAF